MVNKQPVRVIKRSERNQSERQAMNKEDSQKLASAAAAEEEEVGRDLTHSVKLWVNESQMMRRKEFEQLHQRVSLCLGGKIHTDDFD